MRIFALMHGNIHLLNRLDGSLLEAGCDEAGRGPLAGPVFAAAVILPEDFHHPLLNDSKKMTRKAREFLRQVIEREAVAYAVEAVSVREIDAFNILNASIAGMWRAVMRLSTKPEFILVDGNRFWPCSRISGMEECDEAGVETGGMPWKDRDIVLEYSRIPYQCIVKGDGKYASIAAASVLAKTYRDEYMRNLAGEYPQYGWDRNMGYPTREHIEAIRKFGLTPYHRKSFHIKELEPSLF